MRSEECILKYLTRVFLIGTILRKCALPENGKLGKCDVKTDVLIDNCQLMFVGPGDQTGRPYIHRLMDSGIRRRAIVNCSLSIVN